MLNATEVERIYLHLICSWMLLSMCVCVFTCARARIRIYECNFGSILFPKLQCAREFLNLNDYKHLRTVWFFIISINLSRICRYISHQNINLRDKTCKYLNSFKYFIFIKFFCHLGHLSQNVHSTYRKNVWISFLRLIYFSFHSVL
jgi:hypothetical protein